MLIAGVFAWLVGGFLLVKFAAGLGPIGLAAAGTFGVVGLAGLGVAWAAVGRRVIRELRAGYTTLELTYGRFSGIRPTWRRGTGRRIVWDYSGVWRLGPDGRPVRAPDHGTIPPGLYPSPNHQRRWELWTGVMWAGEFHRPPSDVR